MFGTLLILVALQLPVPGSTVLGPTIIIIPSDGPVTPTTNLVQCNSNQINSCGKACTYQYGNEWDGTGYCAQSDDGNSIYCRCNTRLVVIQTLETCNATPNEEPGS